MNHDELLKYAQENGERFWKDAGNHWLNDRFELMANARVIEVGGYKGDWTDYIASKYECFVDTYEPVKEYYEHMRIRFSNRPKIQAWNYGIAERTKSSHIAVMDEGSSMHNGGVEHGPVVMVLDAVDVVGKFDVDLLALNCEGGEYAILERLCDTGAISKVKRLLVQFHTVVPDAKERRDAIREKLSRTHHVGQLHYAFMWESWRINYDGFGN